MEKKTNDISWISLWRVFLFGIFVIIAYQGRSILLGLFLAIVISSGLEFVVTFLERRGLPRTLGVILVFLFGVVGAIILVYAIIQPLIIDLNTVFASFNKIAKDSWLAPFVSFKTAQSFNAFISNISNQFFSGSNSPLGAVSNVVGSVVLGASVLITSFYLSLSRDGVERFIRAVFPPDQEEAATRIYTRSRHRIGVWFRTQIALSILMAALVTIALYILNVRYAVLIGILAGIFELMPYVGPIVAGSIATLVALMTSPTTALYTLIVFLALHQIESHILVPLIVGRSVGLHPVIVIIALLIGAEVGGLMGILISVPAAVVFQEVIEDWGAKRTPREVSLI